MAPRNQQPEMIFQNQVIALTHGRNLRPVVLNPARFNQRIAGNKGFPDLMVVGPGGVLFRELKTTDGMFRGLRPDQVTWRDWLQAAGQDWKIWSPLDLNSGLIEHELAIIEVANEHSNEWALAQLGIPAAPRAHDETVEDADDSGDRHQTPAGLLTQLADIGAYLFTSSVNTRLRRSGTLTGGGCRHPGQLAGVTYSGMILSCRRIYFSAPH